jgi:hypothetical protein
LQRNANYHWAIYKLNIALIEFKWKIA